MRTHIGQYRIEAPLGRGGMGVVYQGVHEHLGRPVAIKALAPELTQQPEFKERFFAEAKTQARLQHPNIVGVYDLLEEGGEYFIVMEFVAGEGLDERMKAAAGRPMDLYEAVGICSQVLAALDYAHSEGVIHRDIKPSNVMISSGRVKLTDFGIALLIGDKRLTASQSSIGTPTYMSPEQIVRPRSVDHRTDLYSIAIVFYEMLAGRPPFDDETEYGIKKLHVEAPLPDITQIRPSLPAGVVQALATALSKNPDDRFASAGQFLRAIQEAVPQAIPRGSTPLPVPAYRPTTLDSTWSSVGTAAPAAPAIPAPPMVASPPMASAPAGAGGKTVFGALLEGKNRWITAAAAAVLVLILGFGVVALILSAGDDEEQVAAAAVHAGTAHQMAATGASPAPAQIPAEAVPLPMAAGEPAPTPLAAPAIEPQQLSVPAAQPTTAPPPQQQPKPARKKTIESAPPPAVAPPSPPPSPVEQPKPVESAPEPERHSPGSLGIDQFKEMESFVVTIARLSEQAFEAYEEEGRQDDLYGRLEGFYEAAEETKREFRRITGTGVRGTFSKLRGRGGQGDSKALQIKVEDLARRAGDIDRLINSSSTTTQDYWKEVRSNLSNLRSYF